MQRLLSIHFQQDPPVNLSLTLPGTTDHSPNGHQPERCSEAALFPPLPMPRASTMMPCRRHEIAAIKAPSRKLLVNLRIASNLVAAAPLIHRTTSLHLRAPPSPQQNAAVCRARNGQACLGNRNQCRLTAPEPETHIIVFMCSTWSDISFTTALIFSTDPSEDFQISSI